MTNYYHPIYVPTNNGDGRTKRERLAVKCIEEDKELEALYIGGGGFNDSQIQAIQACVDAKEEDLNRLPSGGAGILLFALIVVSIVVGIWVAKA